MARSQKDEFTNLPTHNAPDDIKEMLAAFAQLKRDIETRFVAELEGKTELQSNHEWRFAIRISKDNSVSVAVCQSLISSGSGKSLDLFAEEG